MVTTPRAADDAAAVIALIAEGQQRRRPPGPGAAPAPGPTLRAAAGAGPDDPLDIDIYDTIGGWFGLRATGIIDQIRAAPTRPLRVHLNSPGGDVFDGLAVYNTLRQHEAPVEIRIEGLAASIASVIALGGQSIVMAEASLLMIHEPHAIVIGDAHDMRHMAGLLEKTTGILASVYQRRTGADRDRIRAWMHAETWFTAAEALAAGFVTGIDPAPLAAEAVAARSRFDLSAYRHSPLLADADPRVAPAAPAAPAAAMTESAPTPTRRLAAARWWGHQAQRVAFPAAPKETAA